MELTIDDCMVLAARESATEPELRAAVCVAVGQALHHRYEANGYNEAAEVARRDADRFLADWHSAKRERDEARSRASMLAQDLARAVEERDDARARVAMEERERDRAVQEREAFSLRLSAAERERDEARAALDLARESAREAREEIAQSLALVDEARAALDAAIARPTYEARTVAPTIAEWRGHFRAGGSWIVLRPQWVPLVTILRGAYLSGADLPCAWPVAGEVSP